MDRHDLAVASTDELCDTFDQLGSLAASVLRHQLAVAAELDRRQAWREDGATSMGAWIARRSGVSGRTGAEQARVATALEELPAISDALGTGSLSFDQVKAVTWFASPATDQEIAACAPMWSVAALQRKARRARGAATDQGDKPWLRLRPDIDAGFTRISGRLAAADGAIVAGALKALFVKGDQTAGHEQRLAAALVDLCRAGTSNPALLVVHTDVAALASGKGLAELEDGSQLPARTFARLACDARIQTVLDEMTSGVLGSRRSVGIGRMSRVIPPHIMRLLRFRDWCCRFPGCERRVYLDGHHVTPWQDGGPTDLDNLLLLCFTHHKLVHEGGWAISGHPDRQVHFIRPDGTVLREGPVPVRREVWERIWGPDPPDSS